MKGLLTFIVIIILVVAGFFLLKDEDGYYDNDVMMEESHDDGYMHDENGEHMEEGDKMEEENGEAMEAKDGIGAEIEVDASADSGAVQKVVIESGSFFFSPNVIEVEAGREVEVTINAKGTHTFTIDELGVDETTSTGSTTVTFTPDTPGTYTFYCAIPGHRSQGQEGTLIVK